MLVLYGLGVIIGAGIYVLVGSIAAKAGAGAPWSFVMAGLVAAMTGLSYAELAVRFPEAAGAAAYVKEAFGSDRLSRLTGLAVAAVVVVSIASGLLGPWTFIEGAMRGMFAAAGISACVQLVAGVMLASGARPGRIVGYSVPGRIALGCAWFLFFVPLAVLVGLFGAMVAYWAWFVFGKKYANDADGK